MAFPIKKIHVELNFIQIEFHTNVKTHYLKYQVLHKFFFLKKKFQSVTRYFYYRVLCEKKKSIQMPLHSQKTHTIIIKPIQQPPHSNQPRKTQTPHSQQTHTAINHPPPLTTTETQPKH